MPKKKTTTNPSPKKTCEKCKKDYRYLHFYKTKNPMNTDGMINICKKCFGEVVDTDSVESVKKALQLLDVPYLHHYWVIAQEKWPHNPWGKYITMANSGINEFKDSTFQDSNFEREFELSKETTNTNDSTSCLQDFSMLGEKWGLGFTKTELVLFEKKYQFLKNNYPEKTAMHTEALLKYIKYSVKEELSIAKGDVSSAKSWGQMAKDLATAAKINPSQLSAADLQDGLSTFGQLSKAVGQVSDIISILPKFKERPQDKIDFALWCYINYIRDLKGLPACEYSEIWNFYQQRIVEFSQKLDFLNDKTEKEGDESGIL